jgi:tetratricopeptide (TPR) repeat protein
MRIHRFLSLTDLVVFVLVAVAILLPRRPLYAVDAYKLEAEDRADLASAEAAVMAHPDDGIAVSKLTTALMRAGQLDWAVEASRDGALVATAETRWRALLAESEAYAQRGKIEEALDAAQRALDDGKQPTSRCPDYELLKLELWVRYLEAGLKSGIDPIRDPVGFRQAADSAMNWVDIGAQTPGSPGAGSSSAPR